MRMETTVRKGVHVVALHGRLVLGGGSSDLCDRSRILLGDERVRQVVLDLTELEYMDSAGVGELVACAKRAAEAGAVIRLAAAEEGSVRRILRITCLDRVFEVYPDVDAAVAAFA